MNDNQPTFFDQLLNQDVEPQKLARFALGEFQARKKELAERELPLDRLRGAFRRAAENFKTSELTDEQIVKALADLGAKIVRVPAFVAKHPFRVTVNRHLAETALEFYQREIKQAEKL